ncbi:MAG: hypothetical protein K0R84_79 [Clostridia bacterium]|jgi:hydrophobe/amphiphile efflux-3 (HAE3) family protein|nr:hypothetical protein [Clostridia bacterium]
MIRNITEKQSIKSAAAAITKMAPAILTALVATGLGFLALYTSPVPMIQDFGKMLTIGMVVSFFIGLLFAIPILYTRDRFFSVKKSQSKKKINSKSTFEAFLYKLVKKIVKLKWLIILLAFITAGAGIWADMQIGVETDVETFMPQDTQELKDIHRLRDIVGTTDQVSILYSAENVISEEGLQWIDSITQVLPEEFPEVVVESKSITTVVRQANNNQAPTAADVEEFIADMPSSQLKLLLKEDMSKGVITVGIKHLEAGDLKSFIDSLNTYVAENTPSYFDITITGKSVLDVEMMSALTSGRYKMTILGMIAVFLGLLLIYRHPVKAFVPILPIILIVGWSGAAMYLLDMQYTPLTSTLGALIIGIGTEFTILVMERFFEERKLASSSTEAVATAISKIGKAIFASAFTTIGGFSALTISDFKILSNFGMMTLINISFALLSTVLVMPAILVLTDRFVKIKRDEQEELEVNAG